MSFERFLFFYFYLIFFFNIKSENVKIKEIDEKENFTNNYNNIKLVNKEKHNVFNSDNSGYIVNDIYIQIDDDKELDSYKEHNEELKEAIFHALTFSKDSYINLKNNTISNNIKRLKRLFKYIDDITIECKLNKDKIDLYIKIKKYKTIKEIICESKIDFDIKKLNNELKNKYITYENIENIKKLLKNKDLQSNKFIIIDNETQSENIFEIKKKHKDFLINKIIFKGNNNIKSNIIFNKLSLKGIENNSIGRNLVNEFISTSINDLKLQNLILNLQKDVFVWSSIYFDKNKFESDKNEIIQLYIKNGYLDVKFDNIEIVRYKNSNVIDIIYNISEGQKYFVGDIEVIGNKNISNNVINKILHVNKGDIFNFTDIQNKILGNPMNPFEDNIKNLYSSLGYLKVDVKIILESIKDNYVNLKILINEGEIVNINKINIIGNRFTNNQFFYRNSFLFPGDKYNSYKFLSTQQNIMRNEYLVQGKSLVTLDNDNNIQIIVEEKLRIEPVFNIKAQAIDSDYYCDCCKCCKVAPAINLGIKLGNLNLRKLLHIKDPKYLFLGNGDDLNFNIIYSPVDSKFNVGLDVSIREISKSLGGSLHFLYSSFRGAIDNEDNNFSEKKEDKLKKLKNSCIDKVNNLSFLTRFIYSNFSRDISLIVTPVHFNINFGRNKNKVFRCYVDIPIGIEFKYSNIGNIFWNTDGLEFSSTFTISNPIVFAFNKNIDKKYKIHKNIKFLNIFSLYKSIIKNLVFNFSSNIGICKAIGDTTTNYLKIKKDDNDKFETTGIKNITYLYLKGIVENNNILRTLNRSNCYLGYKMNIEMRYLFLTSPLINSYIFCFFNAGNLFAGQNKNEYKHLKTMNNKGIFNPFRFYSFGVGLRIEPEIIKMMLPLTFSIYFDFKNKDLSFNIIKPS